MKYLFFDIECANCYDGAGKICEFGYVLTDENFAVLEEKSLKINPRAPFDKKGFGMGGIHLEHPFAFYKTQPDFPYFYPRIQQLLCSPDHLVVGHGTENDVRFLLNECERYDMLPLDFKFYDTCELAKVLYGRTNNLNLKALYGEFCGHDDVEQNHRSLEDAYMTRDVAKFYARDLRQKFRKIVASCPEASGECFGGRMMKGGVPALQYARTNHLNKKNKQLVRTFIQEEMVYKKTKTFVLPAEFENDHFSELMVILHHMKEKQLSFSFNLWRNCIYVMQEGANGKLAQYRQYMKEKHIHGDVKWISMSDFLQELGLSEKDLQISPEELERMIGNMQCNRDWYTLYLQRKKDAGGAEKSLKIRLKKFFKKFEKRY
ncbi:MAG: 3'-5' exonuclease [Clostridia bacterium]|nr:3'-5' exonuclease [Clostridia bacterium]